MSEKIFLQEMSATAAFFDVRRFSTLTAELAPMDVGVALRRYYEHIEAGVLQHEGQVVKFLSDGVLALFPTVGERDHAGNALRALRSLAAAAPAWLAQNQAMGLPLMEYSAGVATGRLLFGELGTARQRGQDLLGLPVIRAIKLSKLATVRGTPHLILAATVQAATEPALPSVEVEDAELAGQRVRLYRLIGPQDPESASGGGRESTLERGAAERPGAPAGASGRPRDPEG